MSLAVLWPESLYGRCDADRMFEHSDGRIFKVVGVVVDESLVLYISNGVFTGPWLARC